MFWWGRNSHQTLGWRECISDKAWYDNFFCGAQNWLSVKLETEGRKFGHRWTKIGLCEPFRTKKNNKTSTSFVDFITKSSDFRTTFPAEFRNSVWHITSFSCNTGWKWESVQTDNRLIFTSSSASQTLSVSSKMKFPALRSSPFEPSPADWLWAPQIK